MYQILYIRNTENQADFASYLPFINIKIELLNVEYHLYYN